MIPKRKIPISVTLNEDQLAWIDQHVDSNRFATRSHAIVYALTHLMREEEEARTGEQGNHEVPCIA